MLASEESIAKLIDAVNALAPGGSQGGALEEGGNLEGLADTLLSVVAVLAANYPVAALALGAKDAAGKLQALVSGAHGGLVVEGVASGVPMPVSAASLPLPVGAATDRTTAAAPAAVRLSADGTNFVDSTHPVRTDPTGTTTQPVSVANPTAASVVRAGAWTVAVTAAELTGSFPRGGSFINVSTSGQTIFFGPSGVTTTGATKGFPLAPGASIDRRTWQDLTIVFAIADAAGASLSGLEL